MDLINQEERSGFTVRTLEILQNKVASCLACIMINSVSPTFLMKSVCKREQAKK